MVYSFVFLGERNKHKILEEFSSKIRLSTTSYQVIFLSNKPQKPEKLSETFRRINFKTIIFKESAESEEMFETLIHSENLGTVILFKESAENINFNDVNKMLEQNSRGAKIVISKQNKSTNWFFKTWQTIRNFFVKIFLGFNLYPGEADIVLMDNILVSTLSEMIGKSAVLTKVNAWSGVEPKVVTIDAQPQKPKENLNIRTFSYVLFWECVLLGMIVGNVLFAVLNVAVPFLAMFAYIVVEVGVFGLFMYTLTRALFKVYFGKVGLVTETEIVNIINNFDE